MPVLPHQLDPRLHAYRHDLADKALAGQIVAGKFVEGRLARVADGRLAMFGAPDLSGPMVSELRHGECVDIFEQKRGIAWVQNRADRYVGYAAADGLEDTVADSAWRVVNLSTYLYPEPDVKTAPKDLLPFPARVAAAEALPDGWAQLTTGGFVYAAHLESAATLHADYVFTAGRLLGVPYLWGGRTALGIDCPGLVQLALELAGYDCPRDSDMQRAALGVAPPSDWRDYPFARGDLVFLGQAHVGMMADSTHLLHATEYHMRVISEPLADVAPRYRDGITAIGVREKIIRLRQSAPARFTAQTVAGGHGV